MTKDEKRKLIAEAFIKEQPKTYEGVTVEELAFDLAGQSDGFIDFAFEAYYPEMNQ